MKVSVRVGVNVSVDENLLIITKITYMQNIVKKFLILTILIVKLPPPRIVVLISSKIGNQKLPRLLKDISDKGYFIKDIHMITRNVLNDVLSSAGPELADQYMMLSDKRELECFKFICDTTQNTCNFIIDMVGPNP